MLDGGVWHKGVLPASEGWARMPVFWLFFSSK